MPNFVEPCRKPGFQQRMRLVIQRVLESSVSVDGIVTGAGRAGLLVLVGVETGDGIDDARWLAAKTAALRIFARPGSGSDIMDASVADIGGDIVAVSQFTLTASTRKGNRPSYIRAAKGDEAQPLYEAYCTELESITGKAVGRGVFGADMKVALVNDGPVTIIIDSRLRE